MHGEEKKRERNSVLRRFWVFCNSSASVFLLPLRVSVYQCPMTPRKPPDSSHGLPFSINHFPPAM